MIRLISDLHLEFIYDLFEPHSLESSKNHIAQILPEADTDKDTILVVNGDVAGINKINRITCFSL